LTVGAVLVDEGLPRRDDAGRVTSHGRHVSELHPLGITIQDGSQRGDLGASTTTRIGSPAVSASPVNAAVPARNSL
jgi:hypothetical protein